MAVSAQVARGLVVLLGSAAAAQAAAGDPAAGHRLARAWCAQCHAVEANERVSPNPRVPSFAAAARQISTTEMALHAFLSSPHPTMPNVKLSPDETDDIAAYILSLRQTQR